jgi:hypothetical protein
MHLIPTDCLLYCRRLAKELNALPDGFYYGAQRFTKASASAAIPFAHNPGSMSKGMLRISRQIGCGSSTSTGLVGASLEGLRDAYGNQVVAPRHPPKTKKK